MASTCVYVFCRPCKCLAPEIWQTSLVKAETKPLNVRPTKSCQQREQPQIQRAKTNDEISGAIFLAEAVEWQPVLALCVGEVSGLSFQLLLFVLPMKTDPDYYLAVLNIVPRCL